MGRRRMTNEGGPLRRGTGPRGAHPALVGQQRVRHRAEKGWPGKGDPSHINYCPCANGGP